MGNNQSNHFPHIPEKVTWSLNTIINGKSQTLLSDFFEGRGCCTQANTVRDPVNEMAELATEQEPQFTTARANQTTGLTNGRAGNWAPKVAFSPFCALFL